MAWENRTWEPGKMIPASWTSDVVTRWQIGWDDAWCPPPMTCSYCGGIRPQDALRLIGEGWEVENTTKNYKAYLHPPGFKAYVQQIMKFGGAQQKDPSDYHSPVPPVKLYTYHLSAEEIRRINHMIGSRPPI